MHQVSQSNLHESANFVAHQLGLSSKPKPKLAIVLGSGLTPYADGVKQSSFASSIRFSTIPHFPSSTVEGHKGEYVYATIDQTTPILIANGRLHLYEGLTPTQVVMPIRVLGLLGISTLILTNAAGAINSNFLAGELMAITDHLNLSGMSPLTGPNCAELGPRFVDMSYAYDKDFVERAMQAAMKADIKMHQGIYAGLLGPNFETPAEIRMLKTLGADAVGMSTVLETIAARHMGMRVLAISCLTNQAAGLSTQKITHEEVLDNNAKISKKLAQILTDLAKQLG